MNLLNEPGILMEVSILSDCVNLLAEVTSFLKDIEFLKVLGVAHT
jgi:hypothetical protein